MRYQLLILGCQWEGWQTALSAAEAGWKVGLLTGGDSTPRRSLPGLLPVTPFHLRRALQGQMERGEIFESRGADAGSAARSARREVQRAALELCRHEEAELWQKLIAAQVDVISGAARFLSSNEVVVRQRGTSRSVSSRRTAGVASRSASAGDVRIAAEKIVIATGTYPMPTPQFAGDGERVLTPEDWWQVAEVPPSLTVLGAGVSGMEQALFCAHLGYDVTVVDGQPAPLESADRDIVEQLLFQGRSLGIRFQWGEEVIGIDRAADGRCVLQFASGRRGLAECVLVTWGRVGNTAPLNLTATGVRLDERGRLWCDQGLRTWDPHIWGVGDVIGFPPGHRWRTPCGSGWVQSLMRNEPFTTEACTTRWATCPEVAFVGQTAAELQQLRVPFDASLVPMPATEPVFDDVTRRQMNGSNGPANSKTQGKANRQENGGPAMNSPPVNPCAIGTSSSRATRAAGLLKVLFDRSNRRILGVHAIGADAAALIELGQPVIARQGTLHDLEDLESARPAWRMAYQRAAQQGLDQLATPIACTLRSTSNISVPSVACSPTASAATASTSRKRSSKTASTGLRQRPPSSRSKRVKVPG